MKKMEIEIIDITEDGRAIGKYDGKTVFCQGGIYGEVLECQEVSSKKNIIFAQKTKTIKKSPYKIRPVCPYAEECDGCSFQDLDYKAEKFLKEKSVKNKLKRIANVEPKKLEALKIDTEVCDHYRNKVDLKVVHKKLGYYNRKSHELVPIRKCQIASQAINKIIEKLNDMNLSKIKNIKIRSNYKDQVQISLDYLDDYLLSELKKIDSIIEIYDSSEGNYKLIFQKEEFVDKIGDLKFKIQAPSFFQVNIYNSKVLYDKAKALINLKENDKVLDLYCGIGTTTAYLAGENPATGVEVVKAAVEDANYNKKLNILSNIDFICAKSESVIDKLIKDDYTTVILDPPRKGLDKKVTQAINKSSINKVLYISCNPATLARDLKLFKDGGFELKGLDIVDMFARTLHVETIVLMSRK
ncbi:MAG: class I SAM-dependent RNA methyltransferase [Finegoldia sp.]|nr:class I SAM-dependent RNA methyltransferase [Finegoldia sp.]